MTNEQINDAIAEAIQWKGIWRYRPNYCGDLNAMHEAEMCIPEDKQASYDTHLVAIVGKETGLMPSLQFRCIHASAKQRAKAFLRTFTVGKWREEK